MSDALVRKVEKRFEAFTAPYLDDPGDCYAYRLKITHTKRVLAIAEAIVLSEGLPEPLALAARLTALLHDVGRFPQYRRYRTFRDADSANHAGLSVRHALRQRMLADVPAHTRRLVLGAVFLHNVRRLPALSSSDLRTVAGVIRDSDKLDIYQVMIDHFSQERPKHPEVALNVKADPLAFSPHVLEALRRRETGDYKNIVYVNDFKLMAIGWLYDLNFASSCRMLRERGCLDTIFATLPQAQEIHDFRQQIEGDLARRIDGA